MQFVSEGMLALLRKETQVALALTRRRYPISALIAGRLAFAAGVERLGPLRSRE